MSERHQGFSAPGIGAGLAAPRPEEPPPYSSLFFPSGLRPALLFSVSLFTWQFISHSFPPFPLFIRVTPYVFLISAGFPDFLAPLPRPRIGHRAPGTWRWNRANKAPLLSEIQWVLNGVAPPNPQIRTEILVRTEIELSFVSVFPPREH